MLEALARHLPQQQVDSHLLVEEGEVVIDLVRKHWIVYWRSVGFVLLGFVCWILSLLGPINLGWLLILLGVASIGYALFLALAEYRDVFVVTNMRVFRASGVFAVTIATMPITRILDITVIKPLIGRLLGYGHFVFESAAQEQGLRDIRFIADPDERDLTIQRVVQRAGLRGRTQLP